MFCDHSPGETAIKPQTLLQGNSKSLSDLQDTNIWSVPLFQETSDWWFKSCYMCQVVKSFTFLHLAYVYAPAVVNKSFKLLTCCLKKWVLQGSWLMLVEIDHWYKLCEDFHSPKIKWFFMSNRVNHSWPWKIPQQISAMLGSVLCSVTFAGRLLEIPHVHASLSN